MRKTLSIKNTSQLPKSPGIYFLKNKREEVFYIGKAINIKNRVQNHKNNSHLFAPEIINEIEWIETVNEIEALLKESEYIKKLNPKMNIRLLDDKKYFYVGITNEKLPRIFFTHQPQYASPKSSAQKSNLNRELKIDFIGPYTDGVALKVTMNYLRKLFPYYSTNPKKPFSAKKHGKLPCSYCHLYLCPGPSASWRTEDKSDYLKNIKAIKQVLKGRGKNLLTALKKEMKQYSKEENFEKALELRDLIKSLENILEHKEFIIPWSPKKQSIPTRSDLVGIEEYLTKLLGVKKPIKSIEGYDVSNIQGKEPTASMVRFSAEGEHGQWKPSKSLYRKFNITSTDEPNDYLMMREVIKRRLKHKEWAYPDLMLIDGGRGQLNAVLKEMRKLQMPNSKLQIKPKNQNPKNIKIAALAKKEEKLYITGKTKPIPLAKMPQEVENLLKHIRDEAHRFAISHHRARHRKQFKE